jgi:pimeloyl-ACP methyl ester carboxylesterase
VTVTVTETKLLVFDHEVVMRQAGAGRPLLFLHAEADTSGWSTVHDGLAAEFAVHAPVHPGFGGDPLPDWLEDTSDLAFHYADLVTTLDLGRPLVVGAGIGGWIALDLAVHRPDLVGGLLLVGALGLRPSEPMPDLFLMAAPLALGYLAEAIDAGEVDAMTGDVDAATALWVEQATQARLMWERPYDRRLTRRAHHFAGPSSVVWGAGDRLLPVEHGRRLADLLSAELEVVADSGHLVTIDQPGAVVVAARRLAARMSTEGSTS